MWSVICDGGMVVVLVGDDCVCRSLNWSGGVGCGGYGGVD